MSSPPPAGGEDLLQPLALEIRHLRLLLAVAETGSLGRAGERLHLTQSALSHQLRDVEHRLGVALFDRVRNRLVLTEAGGRVLETARRVLAEMSALEGDLRERAAGRRGLIRITTECYTCYGWLPPLVERFALSHPRVEVRIALEATRRPLDALRAGTVDAALVTVSGPDLEARRLFEDELLLVVAPDHRLAARRFVRPADLASERLLLYAPPDESRFFSEFVKRAGVTPAGVAQVPLTEAVVAMVQAGLGVAALARWAVADELRRGRLVGLRLGPRGMTRRWQAATRRGATSAPHLADFLDLLAAGAPHGRAEARRRAG